MKKNILITFLIITSVLNSFGQPLHQIIVNGDGTFEPQFTYINEGDTVEWLFQHRTDNIIPVESADPTANWSSSYLPYDNSNINEFTGPMPIAVSGTFAIGPDGKGFQEFVGPPTTPCVKSFKMDSLYLCDTTGVPYQTMDRTWEDSSITGVFIKLRWSDVQPSFDSWVWTDMDREIQKAVDNGKMYSLSFKAGAYGTPSWIFDDVLTNC